MSFEYHRASIRQVVCTNVLVYARACASGTDQEKITMCMYRYNYTSVSLCNSKVCCCFGVTS